VVEALTDGEALARSRTDPEAFLVVFDRHFDTIGRYLARRLPRDLAADLASETFARAFARRGRFDTTRADALPFLYGIAANLVRRHRRSEQRMLRAYARVERSDVSAPPETAAGGEVASALAALRPAEREILLLFAWADLDYEQIADTLQVPVGTVRSRLSRARRQLRERLAPPPRPTPEEALDE
jgi:RNA polymerase sigma-70 factor (ECF subfamily)